MTAAGVGAVAERQLLSSVRNAARILKQFNSRDRELGISQLARRLDLGKSTVHRLVSTLVAEHLLEQNPDTGQYRLGLAIFDLSASVSRFYDLHEAVNVPMERLRATVRETVQVGVLDQREVVYVERLDSPNTLRLFSEVGRRNWAHSTGTGKALLAFIPTDDLEAILDGWDLPRLTEHTITDPEALRADLEAVRSRGYSTNVHESEVGVISVGAPIRGAGGKVVAALSVAGPELRMEAIMDQISIGVMEAAAMASRRLGHGRR